MANSVKKTEKSVVPIYGAAAVWAAYAVFFNLYRITDFIFAALLSAGACLLLQSFGESAENAADSAETETPSAQQETGNPELNKMLLDGQMALSEMRRLDANIADETISAAIRQLETVCGSIFRQVQENPSKLPQIRKFMDYYLPTALKLLNAYDRMSAAGVSGQNIDSTKQKVEDIMGAIVSAFEKQLDSLFGSDAMDISTDISVLETMLAREGLTGGNPGGSTDIDLHL